MTGLENTGVSIEQYMNLQKQVSEISGKFDEQAKMIVTTVKNEQYRDIIQTSNSITSGILTTFSFVFGAICIIVSAYISWLFYKIAIKADEIEKKKTEVEEFIKTQENIIFDRVMENMINAQFERIGNIPRDIHNLFGTLATQDKKYLKPNHYHQLVRGINSCSGLIGEDQYYQTIRNFILLVYQYFPENMHLLLFDYSRLPDICITCAYEDERKYSTSKIISRYNENRLNAEFIKSYLGVMYDFHGLSIDEIESMLGDGLIEFSHDNYKKKLGPRKFVGMPIDTPEQSNNQL